MTRKHRKIERTPEQLAELKAVRERFQREKPTRTELEASGEYGPGMPTAAYLAQRQATAKAEKDKDPEDSHGRRD